MNAIMDALKDYGVEHMDMRRRRTASGVRSGGESGRRSTEAAGVTGLAAAWRGDAGATKQPVIGFLARHRSHLPDAFQQSLEAG
jgi:hypothetical protein